MRHESAHTFCQDGQQEGAGLRCSLFNDAVEDGQDDSEELVGRG